MTFTEKCEAYFVGLMILILGGIGLCTLLCAATTLPREWTGWLDWRTALADNLTEAMPHRPLAKAAFGILEHDLFGQGSEGVLIGKSGILFSNQDIPQFRMQALEIETNLLAYITAAADRMEAKGAALVIILLPDKRRILAEHFPHAVPPWLAQRYDRVAQSIDARGLGLVRADAPLKDLGTAAFMTQDTHWSIAGSAAVARHVGLHIRQAFPDLVETNPHELDEEDLEILEWEGDLRTFLSLPLMRLNRTYPPQTIARPYIAAQTYQTDAPEITVVGTSYTGFRNADVDDPWMFTDFLRFELGADIGLCSDWGEGVETPFGTYWQRVEQGHIPAPKLLIWEIPERYFGYRIPEAEIDELGSLFEKEEDQTCD